MSQECNLQDIIVLIKDKPWSYFHFTIGRKVGDYWFRKSSRILFGVRYIVLFCSLNEEDFSRLFINYEEVKIVRIRRAVILKV